MSLRYPIGKFELPAPEEAAARRVEYVKSIGGLPDKLSPLVNALEEGALLDNTYRPDGWTARQVIHHLVDSHTNAYVRHKRVLTEDHPTLTPYDETRWAELTDVEVVPVRVSLDILRGLHLRWATLLATCTDAQWERTALHPGSGWTYRLDTLAAHYDWHGRHHIGHLEIILGQ
ncbi:YfiT family bacillithiol transferase [Lewinella sp. W8]|uniref:YfiT family bacillithiol transferase n=1 Tax=Lewinella sp. W8 TaxID=2528208 RepID=UPI001068B4CB|nr:putative metal-dependent hydrolase [Lewinella sp. W8]MTB52248.1 putative metal-dependent hydrolase [Lewinella sp. W8]